MRKLATICASLFFGLFLFCGSLAASDDFDDLSALIKSGAGEDVILAYVDASRVPYDLTVDEILYLNDLGVSSKIITAIVDHGKALRAAAAPAPVIRRPEPEPPPREVVRETVVESAPEMVAPPPEELNVSYFYGSLAPYGNWVSIEDTWCWRPTAAVVDVTWRPYLHRGHWVWTDYGWCWHSDYSWGWAPFHYGRWNHHGTYGWVWTPDTVWGPAWVSWRTGDTHWGWAPLPREAVYEAGVGFHYRGKNVGLDFSFGLGERDYAFVPHDHFIDSGLATYVAPRRNVTNIYNNTTIIQNNYTYNDNRIINKGPSVQSVREVTKHDIREVRLADAEVKPGQTIHGTALRGDTMVIYRPKVEAKAPESPAVAASRQRQWVQERNDARKDAHQSAVEARKDAHVEAVEAHKDAVEKRKDAHADAVEARKDESAAARDARRQKELAEQQAKERERAAAEADAERKRLEKAADKEYEAKKREALKAQEMEDRIKAADARKAQREAEAKADAQRKAANAVETAAEKDKVKADKEAAREAAKREEAQQEEDRKAKKAAEKASRNTTTEGAGTRETSTESDRKAHAKAGAGADTLTGRSATPPPPPDASRAPTTPAGDNTTQPPDDKKKKKKKGQPDDNN